MFQRLLLFLLVSVSARAAPLPKPLMAFFNQHCFECHDDAVQKGDLDLTTLPFDLEDPATFDQWMHVLDRVEQGEMPPEKKPRPAPEQLNEFSAELGGPLLAVQSRAQREFGRGRLRRLNRSEFETTLSDLLGRPFEIQEDLPEDARQEYFDTVGDALNVSSVQIEAYLEALDKVLDRSTSLYERPSTDRFRLSYLEQGNIMQTYRRSGPYQIQEDGIAMFATRKFSHFNAVLPQYTVPQDGRYKVRVSAYTIRSDEPIVMTVRAGGTGHAESNHVPHVDLDHFGVDSAEPQVFEWEGWLERGHYFHVYPSSLRPMRFVGAAEGTQAAYEGPALVVQWLEVEGPILDQWPPTPHQALWNGIPLQPIREARRNKDHNEHLRQAPDKVAKPRMTLLPQRDKESGIQLVFDPDQEVGGEPIFKNAGIPNVRWPVYSLAPEDPEAEVVRLLTGFLPRAYRRDVLDGEADPFIQLALQWMEEGATFEEAMRVGYKAILTSPGFLYHSGSLPQDGPQLSGEALASRLSYFLWNSAPDEKLLELARDGSLQQPAVLRQQVERLLDDPRSDRFVENFLGQWLDLRLIRFTEPDSKLYPEHDQLLEWSMLEETHGFFREMIDQDLPISTLIDSDFAMVNWRLARHYGLPGVDSMELQKVALPKDSVRGGLLTQASVLKVTANGTTTSPVVRGVWVSERIMGQPHRPPPPSVPAIEPDIRGATTVREQLEQHRASPSCAACHAHIDPPGMVLESFDVIGGWRDLYRALDPEKADIDIRFVPRRAPPVQYTDGPPVDPSDILPDGRTFRDIHEFKRLLLADDSDVTRGLTRKLITYSTGAPVQFVDRAEVDRIAESLQKGDGGLRSLLHAIVQSRLFQIK